MYTSVRSSTPARPSQKRPSEAVTIAVIMSFRTAKSAR
jgi:hypothetical protein